MTPPLLQFSVEEVCADQQTAVTHLYCTLPVQIQTQAAIYTKIYFFIIGGQKSYICTDFKGPLLCFYMT